MSGLMDYTHYLAKVIGPRPTGTEEEQQAALYITEQFQRETGFSANIEEFQRTTRPDLSYAILGSVIVLVTILSIFLPAISIATFIVIALVAAIYILETFGHPLLSRMLARGASQNVVAKYQPNLDNSAGRSVTRKIILVAHYDSGHVTPSLVKRLDSGKVAFNVIESGVMALLAFLALIRIFVAITGGGALIILNAITVIALLVALLPLVRFILLNNAPYNEGANNNASGSAALIEIARRICQGSVSENDLRDLEENVTIHGIDAAMDAGYFPEEVELSYEAAPSAPVDVPYEDDAPGNEEDRLLAAKAAIAALTGRPVENKLYVTSQTSSSVPDAGQTPQPGINTDMQFEAFEAADPASASETIAFDELSIAPDDAALPKEADAVIVGEGEEPAADAAKLSTDDAVPNDAPASEEPAQREMSISAYFAAARAQENGAVTPIVVAPEPNAAQALPVAEAIADAAAVVPAAVESAEESSVAGFQNVPSWFAAAQKNAKRSNTQVDVQRSRYTEALEYAEQERIDRETAQLNAEKERQEAERLAREAEARAHIEAQQREAEEARKAQEEAARAAEETKAAQAAADDIAQEIATETPVPGLDDQAPQAEIDLVQEALDYKAAQATENTAAFAQSTELPAEVSPEAINSATQAVVNRQERLKSLRTNIPSLSGVIRTKDAARRAAVESLSSKLRTTDMSAQTTTAMPAPVSNASASATVAITPEAQTNASSAATPLRDAPAPRNLQAVVGGRPLSAIPSPADDVAPSSSYNEQEIDYDMVVSDYGSDFGGGLEDDFASNLFNEDAYDDGYDNAYQDTYNYSEYDNAFLDDDDFAVETKPKRKGFFSRFRRKKEEEEMETPQQWLGVDDDFDARNVGRARGGWESFRQDYDDHDDPFNDDGYDDFGDFGESYNTRSRGGRGGRWEGGSYSRMSLGHVDMRSGVDTDADTTIPDVPPEAEKDRFITGEIERIYHFRNPAFNTEIWFVAMGCDDDSHDGVRAFINEHKSELRGSMVIEIESMGAGVLSVAKREGATKKISASSRIKRYTREAVAATGIALDEVDLSGTESIASIIQKAGFQSMHLFGAEDGHPALKGSADDVFENIDELVFDENTRFVYELLRR